MSNQQKVITGMTPFPDNPLFSVKLNSMATNVTGDGTVYTVGFNTEIFDRTNSFNTGTSTFTAPAPGAYLFTFSVFMQDLGVANTIGNLNVNTSNRMIKMGKANYGAMRTAFNGYQPTHSCIADMDAADTATIELTVFGCALIVDVFGDATSDLDTFWQGVYLG